MTLRRVVRWAAGGIAVALLAGALVAYFTSDNVCPDPARSPPRNPMKAVIYCEYGSPDVLQIRDVEKPSPADGEVLVKVRAAALNPLDWHFMRGTPYVGRAMGMGLRKPKDVRLGVDFAGTVEAVGRTVTRFKPGDEVFGARHGAFAEYLAVPEGRVLVPKPSSLTFEQAAAVPVAGLTALQGLRDKGRIRPGQKVLVNGASGGVGPFAVQIAKAMGAEVTGVCSTRNVELVRSLGADRVIDYTREDFTADGRRYDVLFDNVGNRSLLECRRALNPEGIYVMIGGPKGQWLAPLDRALRALAIAPFVSQKMGMLFASLNRDDLATLADLMQAGKVRPVLDRTYRLSELPAAMRYLEEGHARGKVVVVFE
jgi:NADPH:quinone reductase-like Zn-dependent oxidoreductase